MNETKRGFKTKTIEKTIRHKMAEWIKTLPEDIRENVTRNYIVTGGAITSMLLGDLPNDYDVYFRTPGTADCVVQYYIGKLAKDGKVSEISTKVEPNRIRIVVKSAGIVNDGQEDFSDYKYFEMMTPEEMEKYFEKYAAMKGKDYTPAMISTNAISLHGDIQIIIRFIGAPEEIHKNYDFVHCTNWFTEVGGLVLNQPALESILSRELKYVGSLYPICSLFRIKKFIRRGWSITAGEILKISFDISKLDLQDMNVLQEQLIGVDMAYFLQLIALLKDKQEIDRTYLWECVNRVFDSNEFDMVYDVGE